MHVAQHTSEKRERGTDGRSLCQRVDEEEGWGLFPPKPSSVGQPACQKETDSQTDTQQSEKRLFIFYVCVTEEGDLALACLLADREKNPVSQSVNQPPINQSIRESVTIKTTRPPFLSPSNIHLHTYIHTYLPIDITW